MNTYDITGLTNLQESDHAGRIDAYLRAQGFAVDGVSIGWVDGVPTVTVTADTDPTKALAAYTPTLTPDEQERADTLADAQAALAAIATKARGSRTNTEKVLLGLALGSDALATRSTVKQATTVERR